MRQASDGGLEEWGAVVGVNLAGGRCRDEEGAEMLMEELRLRLPEYKVRDDAVVDEGPAGWFDLCCPRS